MALLEVPVSFDALTEKGNISLTAKDSLKVIQHYWPKGGFAGNKIFLCDGKKGSVAVIEDIEGHIQARLITEIMEVT